MVISIERAEAHRAHRLERLAPDVFDHPVQPQYLMAFLNDPRHVMFLALEDDLVVGMATGFEYFHPDKPPQLFINEVGVSPDWQRRRIGRQLTQALVAEAVRRGCQYAWLGTETGNVAAQACFASVDLAEGPKTFLLYEWDFED